jgi:hypothetical protein
MANFDLLSQLFGSKQGHQMNVAIDTAGEALLGKFGLPTSTAGVIAAAENALDAGINAAPNLTPEEKTTLVNLINNLFARAGAPVTAAPAAAPAEQPAQGAPVFQGIGS